jgi:phage FluMu protein Com
MQMVNGKPYLWHMCPRCRLRFMKPYEKDEKNLTKSEKNDRMREKGGDGTGK